jgi:hypothetical protein
VERTSDPPTTPQQYHCVQGISPFFTCSSTNFPYFSAESLAPEKLVGSAPFAVSSRVGWRLGAGTGLRDMGEEGEGWVGERGGGAWEDDEIEDEVGMRGGRGGFVGFEGSGRGSSNSSCTVGRGGYAEAEVALSAYCGGGEFGVGFDSSAILEERRVYWAAEGEAI